MYTTVLGARESLDDKVTLKPCETYELHTINSPQDSQAVANSTESLQCIEECVAVWIKQIEQVGWLKSHLEWSSNLQADFLKRCPLDSRLNQTERTTLILLYCFSSPDFSRTTLLQVLAESEQMRREADDIGPRAELDHWKKRMSKFNFLLDQIKGQEVKAVLGVLQAAKSKTLKTWQDLDRRITDSANEAKDNVKFLYTLEKFCDPLYNSDPVSSTDSISSMSCDIWVVVHWFI